MRATLTVVGLALMVAGGIYLLREATISTHYASGPDTRLEVVVRATSNGAEPGVTLEEFATVQLRSCTLEVAASEEVAIVAVAGTEDQFRATLTPALDSTDRKQYRGCVEDWAIDNLRLEVLSMTEGTR